MTQVEITGRKPWPLVEEDGLTVPSVEFAAWIFQRLGRPRQKLGSPSGNLGVTQWKTRRDPRVEIAEALCLQQNVQKRPAR